MSPDVTAGTALPPPLAPALLTNFLPWREQERQYRRRRLWVILTATLLPVLAWQILGLTGPLPLQRGPTLDQRLMPPRPIPFPVTEYSDQLPHPTSPEYSDRLPHPTLAESATRPLPPTLPTWVSPELLAALKQQFHHRQRLSLLLAHASAETPEAMHFQRLRLAGDTWTLEGHTRQPDAITRLLQQWEPHPAWMEPRLHQLQLEKHTGARPWTHGFAIYATLRADQGCLAGQFLPHWLRDP
jgi:hypothetical protein